VPKVFFKIREKRTEKRDAYVEQRTPLLATTLFLIISAI